MFQYESFLLVSLGEKKRTFNFSHSLIFLIFSNLEEQRFLKKMLFHIRKLECYFQNFREKSTTQTTWKLSSFLFYRYILNLNELTL